jgi:hypothetical protein
MRRIIALNSASFAEFKLDFHPFDNGNGGIARAISDLQLSRADQSQQCFIVCNRKVF